MRDTDVERRIHSMKMYMTRMDVFKKIDNTCAMNNESETDSSALPEESRQCNPSLPVEMEHDVSRMRGDAIGTTLYSECWVLKILMKLMKFCSEDWSEDVETELCLLWDMTIEPDVVELLMQYDFLDLASRIIRDTTIPRLMEILVGIMGNLSCVPSVRMEIAKRVTIIHMLLDLLSLPDVPTLLQLMRLLQACFWDLRNTEAKISSSAIPEEHSVLHENKTIVSSEPEMITECSELNVSPSLIHGVDGKVGESCSFIADTKQLRYVGNLSVEKSVDHHPLEEVSQHLQSCVVDLKQSRLTSCALHEPDHTGNPRVVESHVLDPDQIDCESDNMNDRINGRQFQFNEESSKEKTEVHSLWLQELCDVNKWLPSVSFILRSSKNEELICNSLAMLDSLSCVPVNNGLLGMHIASPDIVLALVEALKQLHHESSKDEDLCPDIKLEKAVCHWASVLSTFTSFPQGKVALGSRAEALGTSMCNHLIVDKPSNQLSEHQGEFIMLAATVMSSLLEDMGFFHPPTFNCFLTILTFLQGRSTAQRNECNKEYEENVTGSATLEVEQEVIANLEKYFVAVVQLADGEEVAHVLQHCNPEHVAILQSIMEGKKSS
ncbi:hypothetical protein B7P43_G03437 [Cryptotermes secundus]|uniref:Protein SAAL1 n=1 Tax=Cryptotermes secundus TaxID=105785 RepID=A0A2J7RLK8_9NEOP|nr:uncharacterized protein LOC111871249 isoform X3 [Cryptotermes secundus]PNF41689.1 hypothetical protein B7P43_G03437 [Cryptotermes secundus]